MSPSAGTRRTAIVAACCLAVVAVVGLVVRVTDPSVAELRVLGWFTGLPDSVARPLWVLGELGSVFWALVVGTAVLALLRGTGGVTTGWIAIAGAWLLSRAVALLAGRGRPADYLADVDTRFEPVLRGEGYAASHAAVAFALAAVVAGSLPPGWRWLAYVVAAAASLPDLYFAAHLPLDVVGGAALGIAVGLGARTLGAVGPRESTT